MPRICVGVNLFAEVDEEDWLELTLLCSWCIDSKGYPYGNLKKKATRLHRLIAKRMGLKDDNQIDHVDGNKLNNKRINLRAATHGQNQANRRLQNQNASGYKGVSWDKERKRWIAQVRHNGRAIYVGRYESLNEARLAYIEAAKHYHGEFFNDGTN